jgi:hypothetical protein
VLRAEARDARDREANRAWTRTPILRQDARVEAAARGNFGR